MKRRLLVTTVLACGLPATTLAVDEPPVARVITDARAPRECLAAVWIHTIDNEAVTVASAGFSLEPGRHSLTGSAIVDVRACAVSPGDDAGPVPPLEADFLANRVYYVGLDHASPDVVDWRLVIWKVEAEDGRVLEPR